MRLIVRRLVLNIAMSLDGFIARKDGSYDWIEGHQEKQFIVASHTEQTDYGNVRFVRDVIGEIMELRSQEGGEIFGCLVGQVWFRTV